MDEIDEVAGDAVGYVQNSKSLLAQVDLTLETHKPRM